LTNTQLGRCRPSSAKQPFGNTTKTAALFVVAAAQQTFRRVGKTAATALFVVAAAQQTFRRVGKTAATALFVVAAAEKTSKHPAGGAIDHPARVNAECLLYLICNRPGQDAVDLFHDDKHGELGLHFRDAGLVSDGSDEIFHGRFSFFGGAQLVSPHCCCLCISAPCSSVEAMAPPQPSSIDTTPETIEEFRSRAAAFIDAARANGVACPSFGAIMPPAMHDQALVWQRHMFANGWAGTSWPCEFGGQGLPADWALVWSEECARRSTAAYMNFQGFVLAGGALLRFGTEEQKATYLRPTLAAELLWCQLFSEPGSGSDLASLQTRAEATGDGWVVSGQKVWSSTAQLADVAILLARTDPETPGHRGISFFLFDMRQSGVDVRPIKQMTGDREFCEVFLDNAHIRADQLLGPLHGGWNVATSVLGDERAEVGAAGIGLRRRIYQLAAGVGDDPVMRDRIMQITAGGGALHQLLNRSGGDPRLGPLVKLAMTEMESERTRTAVDLLGAAGSGTGDIQDSFLYAPGMRVAGGTSEIQRNLIGERLLGLPREPRPARPAPPTPGSGPQEHRRYG